LGKQDSMILLVSCVVVISARRFARLGEEDEVPGRKRFRSPLGYIKQAEAGLRMIRTAPTSTEGNSGCNWQDATTMFMKFLLNNLYWKIVLGREVIWLDWLAVRCAIGRPVWLELKGEQNRLLLR